MRSRTCPKCSGRMNEGAILTRDSYDMRHAGEWLEGVPEKSIWTGLKVRGRTVLPITSFRCERCGFLENYADQIDNPPTGS